MKFFRTFMWLFTALALAAFIFFITLEVHERDANDRAVAPINQTWKPTQTPVTAVYVGRYTGMTEKGVVVSTGAGNLEVGNIATVYCRSDGQCLQSLPEISRSWQEWLVFFFFFSMVVFIVCLWNCLGREYDRREEEKQQAHYFSESGLI